MDSPLTPFIAWYEGTSSGLFRDFNGRPCLTFVVIVTQATVKFEREILRLSGRGLDYYAETQGTCKHCVSVIGHYNTNKCQQGISNSPRYAFQPIICPFLIRFAKHQDDKQWCMVDKKSVHYFASNKKYEPIINKTMLTITAKAWRLPTSLCSCFRILGRDHRIPATSYADALRLVGGVPATLHTPFLWITLGVGKTHGVF